MKNKLFIVSISLLWSSVIFSITNIYQPIEASINSMPYKWNLPKGFPIPQVPSNNLMTKEKVDLGRYLFYDTLLSVNNSISCSTCHEQKKAFSDGNIVPVGVTGIKHPRNSMALVNIAYNSSLTWNNPLIDKLETQMLLPIFGETPPEMGMSGKEKILLERLSKEKRYQTKFKLAFPNDSKPISINNLTKAIACFERTLISSNSPYDRYIYQNEDNAITESAKRGEGLFFSERLECFHCHGGFNFSDSTKHSKTTFIEKHFNNNGLYNIDGKGSYPTDNAGVYEISNKQTDMGKFRAPTLRNIAITAPYMHDGSIKTLSDVIEHYSRGGRIINSGNFKGDGKNNPYKSGFVKGFNLSKQEKKDLLEFLNHLTDYSFINNSELSSPYKIK